VPYYHSGGFTYRCPKCDAKLLKSEYEAYTRKDPAPLISLCCSDGKVHTEKMKTNYKSLQDPIPAIKVGELIHSSLLISIFSGTHLQLQLRRSAEAQ
jgi:hypothetical protein